MTQRPPSVLIVGGFATLPLNYLPLRARLLRREVARVDVAQIWPADWALASVFGLGRVMRRTARAIVATWHDGGRRPIIVVGHSGGGLAARLAMSTVPFEGKLGGVARCVGTLVTLGTPHGLAQLPNRYHHAGHAAAEFLDRSSPDAFFAPRTSYLTVAGRAGAAPFPGLLGRVADEVFSVIVGDQLAPGDGIVPAAAAALTGAQNMVLDGVRHGFIGSPWYGDDAIIERWWPAALRLWREAT